MKEFREHAPNIGSFNGFVLKAAKDGFIGEENASRLAYIASTMFDPETIDLLGSIAEGDVHAKPKTEIVNAHVFPILKTAVDFDPRILGVGKNQQVLVQYHGPEDNVSKREVAIAYVDGPVTEDEYYEQYGHLIDRGVQYNHRGWVWLDDDELGARTIPPNWPGLVPLEFDHELELRKLLDRRSPERAAINGFGSVFFKMCFFDGDFIAQNEPGGESQHATTAYRMLRNYELTTVTRPL